MNASINLLHRVADAWWSWVVYAGWQSALVGCVLLAVVAWGRRWPSQIRYWLLVIALLKFGVPPLWSAPTGLFSQIAVAPAAEPRELTAVPDPLSASDKFGTSESNSASQPSLPIEIQAEGAPRSTVGREAPAGPLKALPPESVPVVTDAANSRIDWKVLFLAIHILGAATISGWVAVRVATVRSLVARSTAFGPGPVFESFLRCATRIGTQKEVRLLRSSEVAGPFAFGAMRPTIVLPQSAERLSSRELDAILLHELTHLCRGDAWLSWIEVALCAAWWVHPVVWLVHRSLRRIREDCCDDAILLLGVATTREYCDTLVRVARGSAAVRSDLLACHMAHRLHPLAHRISRIMDPAVRRSIRMPVAASAVVAIVACTVLPGLGRSAERPTEPRSTGRTPAARRATSRPASTELAAITAPDDTDPLTNAVFESIARGRQFLAARQNADGSFGPATEKTPQRLAPLEVRPPVYRVGVTSLALLALLHCGMTRENVVIAKGLEFLRQSPDTLNTYELSLRIAVLAAANDPQDKERLSTLTKSLDYSQFASGEHSGMWNYGGGPGGRGAEDNSNTQFAILGLHAASAVGAKVRRDTWQRTLDHFLKHENQDGGWGYQNSSPSTGSMTCAAIASLVICEQELVGKQPGRKEAEPHAAIQRGVEWLGKYYRVGINPGGNNNWLSYYLYGVARAGRLSGRRLLGRHDWYRDTATYLMEGQSARDGSWTSNWTASSGDLERSITTSLVLLCLTEPDSGSGRKPAASAPRSKQPAQPPAPLRSNGSP
jgi:beta-lactamase regulating signal transducer with metallopeptidase domain